MKKFVPLVLGAAVVLPLCACSPTKEHIDVFNAWTEFKTDSQNVQFFNGDVVYSSEIQAAKAQSSSPFHTLTYCETIVGLSLQNINSFYGVFDIVPDYNQNSIRKLCGNVLNQINGFKEEIERFNTEKARFEQQVALFNIDSSAAEAELDDFLLDVGNLTIKACELQVSFTNAFSALYSLPIDSTDESVTGQTQIKCAVATVESWLLEDYVNRFIKEYNGYHPDSTSLLFDAVKKLDAAKGAAQTANAGNYATWLDTYKLFKNENEMFKNSLNQVDLTRDNFDLTGSARDHLKKVELFPENANIFVNKTISLLYQ